LSTTTQVAASGGTMLERVERTAWRIPLPTRRLFITLAFVAAGALAATSLVAGWAASRNADTIANARDQGLGVARAATDFRTHLSNADALAAATLISGGLENPDSRAQYDREVLAASQALTDAALVGTDDDGDAIKDMGNGLVRYAGLVETSRANSRLGYPVGAAYLQQARTLANDDLAPRAEQLRRVGEQRMARAANTVGGPLGALVVALLVIGLLVLAGCALIVAGRTRRFAHPALLAAAAAVIGAMVLVTNGINTQSRELRAAATGDINAYVAANEAANDLSDLRVTEISAVAARGSGADLYTHFRESAEGLRDRLADAPGDDTALRELDTAVVAYTTTVDGDSGVRATDLDQGDNRAAAALSLTGASSDAFEKADGIATDNVTSEDQSLANRLDAASGADVEPLLPIVLGLLAAVLAVAGTLARGRRYR
jgi:hypothetical protein